MNDGLWRDACAVFNSRRLHKPLRQLAGHAGPLAVPNVQTYIVRAGGGWGPQKRHLR
jgi:hypothetical protein